MKIKRNKKIFIEKVVFRFRYQSIKDINLNLLNSDNIYDVLSKYPQLSIYCNWSKLDDVDWMFLLHNQPQLEKYKMK